MNTAHIAWATHADTPALGELMRSLYAHENPEAPATDAATLAQHLALLLADTTPHRLAIAWDETGRALGLAAVAGFVSVSDPRPRHWHQAELKELFVLPGHRGAGIGAALLHWVEARAREKGAYRLDWHVARDNPRGIDFYEREGAQIVERRLSMRKPLTQSA